jgi:hypothetical protein
MGIRLARSVIEQTLSMKQSLCHARATPMRCENGESWWRSRDAWVIAATFPVTRGRRGDDASGQGAGISQRGSDALTSRARAKLVGLSSPPGVIPDLASRSRFRRASAPDPGAPPRENRVTACILRPAAELHSFSEASPDNVPGRERRLSKDASVFDLGELAVYDAAAFARIHRGP